MVTITELKQVLEHTGNMDAVIFDLDDTLYGEKEYVKSGYQKVAAYLSDIPDAYAVMWQAFEKGQSAIDVVLQKGNCFTEEKKEVCLSIYRQQEPDIHLYRDALPVLETLRRQKKKIGIITDGRPEGQRAKIKALRLEPYIDRLIITDELGGPAYRKPCEAAFRIMAEALAVPFESMCYIGDNPSKDFAAPTALGMKSVWFQNTDGLYYRPSH